MRIVDVLFMLAATYTLMLPQALSSQQRPQQHSGQDHLLIPRRVYHMVASPVSGNAFADDLSLTPTTLAANVSDSDSLHDVEVFDRKTCKERWHKHSTRMAEKPAVGAVSVTWHLLGIVARPDMEDVVVVDSLEMKNVAHKDGERLFVFHAQLQGFAARTGRPLWHVPISYNYGKISGLAMVATMVVLPPHISLTSESWEEPFPYNSVAGPGEAPGPFTLRDGASGCLVGIHTPQGQSYLKRLIAEAHTQVLLLPWSMMHLDTGLITPLVEPSGDYIGGFMSRIACSDDRNLMLFNRDNGDTGHSAWPRYVYGAEATGKVVWMFDVGSAFSVGALWQLGMMLVVVDYPRCLYGVRLTDGKIVWHSPEGDYQPPLALYGDGGFVLTGNRDNLPKRLSLVWVSARDGHEQPVGKLDATNLTTISGMGMGPGAYMQVLANTLCVIDDLGVVREYGCGDLLAPRKGVTTPHRTGVARHP